MFLPPFNAPGPGHVDFERSGCEVVFYNRPSLSVSLQNLVTGSVVADGRDGNPSLIECTTHNAINAGGTFQISLKCPYAFNPLTALERNTWVDISMRRGAKSWHVMRGLIDDVRKSERAPANTRTFVVLGRSFQKAWATTPVYFNNLAADNLGGAFLLEAIGSEVLAGTPDANVRAVLIEFIKYIGKVGRANWQLPPGLPGARGTFADSVDFDASGFEGDILTRAAVVAQSNFPEVDLWSLACQFADLQFCEIFTELMPPGGMAQYTADPSLSAGLSPRDSRMTVVFRDRPYPRVSPASVGPINLASPYFRLPTHRVGRVEAPSIDTGWSDQETFNSFTVVGGFTQERVGDYAETQYPLWWPAGMQRDGLRHMPASSMYEAGGLTTDLLLATAQQSRLRDWYCLGGELLSGSVPLARGAPEIKLGSRLIVEGTDRDDRLTFYIEAVEHNWSASSGLSTSLSVTRGYEGTDQDHLNRLTTIASQFVLGENELTAPGGLELVPIPPDGLDLVPIPTVGLNIGPVTIG